MSQLDLLLKNAYVTVFNSRFLKMETVKLDVGIKDSKIVAINSTLIADTQETIDLQGLNLLPGVIDSQVHFREPGLTHKEDLETGTRAAVLGGVTAVFEMPNTTPSTTTRESFQEKLNLAANRAHCDYAFYMGAANDNAEKLSELELLPHCSGVKIFLGASFGNLLVDQDDVFERVVKNGRRRLTIHSEDEQRLKERKIIALEAGNVSVHHLWRDEESALISTKKSVQLAKKYNRPIHILHVSSAEEMEYLSGHKDIATVEILPQFLTLSAPECYERLGTLAQQNPPIRDKRHLEFLWKAVTNNTVDVIGSDHAPHTLEEKAKPYPQSPSGFPGVQTLVPIMLDHVAKGRISLEHFVKLVTENPRKVFGVKNKGRIEIGYDADFTVVDLKKEKVITNKWIASKCGYTPFDGMRVRGWPVITIVRGQIVMREDQVINPHKGKAVDFISSS
jgi:dihydroorotase